MKHLVKHLLEQNQEQILEKSLFNCHVEGLHSIMLLDSPEKIIRLFIAEPGNTLWQNYPEWNNGNVALPKQLSLAFHPHHCDVTLHCIKGVLTNWVVEENVVMGLPIQEWVYNSQILKGEIGFKPLSFKYLITTDIDVICKDESIFLPANKIHTVACSKDEYTAWFVYEGKEDPTYKPLNYSNANLVSLDATKLYKKFKSIHHIKYFLNQINLI